MTNEIRCYIDHMISSQWYASKVLMWNLFWKNPSMVNRIVIRKMNSTTWSIGVLLQWCSDINTKKCSWPIRTRLFVIWPMRTRLLVIWPISERHLPCSRWIMRSLIGCFKVKVISKSTFQITFNRYWLFYISKKVKYDSYNMSHIKWDLKTFRRPEKTFKNFFETQKYFWTGAT